MRGFASPVDASKREWYVEALAPVWQASEDGEESATSTPTPGSRGVHQRLDLVLDATGMARATITQLPKLEGASRPAPGVGLSRPQR